MSANVNSSFLSSNQEYWLKTTHLPQKDRSKIEPYLLPYHHPARESLDKIFSTTVSFIKDYQTFFGSGFQKLQGVSTNALVGSHKELQPHGMIVKALPKYRTWQVKQLLRRVEGHQAGQRIVEENKLKYISVSKNWLYPLPGDCSPYVASAHKSLAYFLCCYYCRKDPKKNRFYVEKLVVVEEFHQFDLEKIKEEMEKICSKELLDEVAFFLEAFGYADAHMGNCPVEDGKILFVDLEFYSADMKKERKMKEAIAGMETFANRVPDKFKEYWQSKINDLTQRYHHSLKTNAENQAQFETSLLN